MTPKDLAKLVAKRFDILHELYPNKESHLSKLAENLDEDIGNISRYIDELNKNGLIKTQEQKRKMGRPFKLCKLTTRARIILASLEETMPREKSFPEWQINMLLDMLQDKNVTQDFHEFITGKLSDIALENAVILLSQKQMKSIFEKVVKNPPSPSKDKVGKNLMSCLSNALPQILAERKTREWFFTAIYNPLLKRISDTKEKKRKAGENGNEEFISWAINIVSRVVRLTPDPKFCETMT